MFYDTDFNAMRQQAQDIFNNIKFEARTKDAIQKAIYIAVKDFIERKIEEFYNSNKQEFDAIIKNHVEKAIKKQEDVNFHLWYSDITKSIIENAILEKKDVIITRVNEAIENQPVDKIRYSIKEAISDYVCEYIFPEKN